MSFARHSGVAQDRSGNVLSGASVRVTDAVTGSTPQLYSDRSGASALGNPFLTSSDGSFSFCVVGGLYNVTATLGSDTFTVGEVGIGTSQGFDAGGIGTSYSAVRVATTANVTIATALNNGDTIDGVVLATGDRVLVWKQTTKSQNGVYVAGASPARATDFDTYDEHSGALLVATEGSTYARRRFVGAVNVGGVLGTTDIVFADVGPLPRFEISTAISGASPTNGEIVEGHVFVENITFPAGLSGSSATARDTATASAVVKILKNGSQVGTVTFGAGSPTGAFALASDLVMTPGDQLDYQFPSPADVTLRGIKITLRSSV